MRRKEITRLDNKCKKGQICLNDKEQMKLILVAPPYEPVSFRSLSLKRFSNFFYNFHPREFVPFGGYTTINFRQNHDWFKMKFKQFAFLLCNVNGMCSIKKHLEGCYKSTYQLFLKVVAGFPPRNCYI
jgi:hypothetical protein